MEEIAEVYARALFEVAKEHDVLDRVHDEVHDQEHHAREQHVGHDRRPVATQDRVGHPPSEARPPIDHLDHHGALEQEAEAQADHGDGRDLANRLTSGTARIRRLFASAAHQEEGEQEHDQGDREADPLGLLEVVTGDGVEALVERGRAADLGPAFGEHPASVLVTASRSIAGAPDPAAA